MGASARIDMAMIEKFLLTDSAVWEQLMKAGKEAVEYWKSEAPVGPKTHTSHGVVIEPGAYRKSIRATMIHKDGRRFVRVQAHDFKAHWVEYGTRSRRGHGHACCAKTRAYMLSKPRFSSGSVPGGH